MSTLKIMKNRSQATWPDHNLTLFRSCITNINRLVKGIGEDFFLSPYSLIAAVSQFMGLHAHPSEMGSAPDAAGSQGHVDYQDFFAYEASLEIHQKRQLINELYDMIAPIILNESNAYVELLMNTKYRRLGTKLPSSGIELLKAALSEKISLVEPIVTKLLRRKGTFAHIAHFGCLDDLYREQHFLGRFEEDAREEWFANSYPIVIELQVTGLCDNPVSGWIIFLPNSSEQLLMNEPLRKKKLLQAATLGKRLGAEIIGLAGLAASFSRGGHFLAKRIQDVGFTTGNAYTIANIVRIVHKISETVDLDLSEAVVAVVGAAGSIGSGVTKLLASQGINNFILIDRDDMIPGRKLELLAAAIKEISGKSGVTTSTDLNSLKSADIVILATCAPEGIIKSDHIKPGAIFIDDSYPKNVHQSMLAQRNDFILLEGGITQLPSCTNMNLSRSIPKLINVPLETIIGTKQTYGCCAETLILAATGHRGHFGLGDASPALAAEIEKMADRLSITLAPLQAFGEILEESRIEKIKGIIKNR